MCPAKTYVKLYVSPRGQAKYSSQTAGVVISSTVPPIAPQGGPTRLRTPLRSVNIIPICTYLNSPWKSDGKPQYTGHRISPPPVDNVNLLLGVLLYPVSCLLSVLMRLLVQSPRSFSEHFHVDFFGVMKAFFLCLFYCTLTLNAVTFWLFPPRRMQPLVRFR